MRIFVTGATGFIGRALVARLLEASYEVVAWVRDVDRAAKALGDGPSFVSTAAPDQALTEAIDGCDAVVNLAGSPVIGRRWTRAVREALVTSRVDLTRRVLEAIGPEGPRVVISSSAVGYYGDRGDEALTEESAPGDDFLAVLCRDWESAALEAAPEGSRVVLIRTGVVLGPGGGALQRMLPPFKVNAGGPIGTGRQVMPWIHLEDMVEVIVTALEDTRYEGPLNATAPQPVTNRVFTQALGKALGRYAVVPVPAFVLRGLFGEAAEVILASQRAIPAALEGWGFPFRHPEIQGALDDLVGEG